MDLGDYTENYSTLNLKFLTKNASDVPTTLAGTPVISVYKANGITQSLSGITLSVDFDSLTGLNNILIDLSSDSFYEAGQDYQIVITTGTVNSVSVVGTVVASFSIENRYNGLAVVAGSAAQGQNASGATITTGTETLTYTATQATNGTLHEVAADAGSTDFYYTTTLPGNGSGTDVFWRGYVQSNSDTVEMQFYDWGAAGWVTERTLSGRNAAVLNEETVSMVSAYTGTGANVGVVRFRFLSVTATNIATDRIIFSFATVAAESGFENGMVWIDTVNGTAGTARGIGIATKPSSNLTDAVTIAGNNSIHQYYMTPNSTLAPSGDLQNSNIYGIGYTCTLGGHDYSGTHIYHASPLTGKATTTGGSDHFDCLDSIVGAVEVDNSHFTSCSFNGTITLDQVTGGDLNIINSRSIIAGATTPVIDCGTAAVTHDISISNWHNGIEIKNLNNGGTNAFSMSGTGKLIVASTCSGTMNVRGSIQIIDNSGGNVTFVFDTVRSEIDSILEDTNTTIPGTITNMQADVDNLGLGIIYGAAAAGTLTTTVATTDLTAYTIDQLIGRVIIVTSGNAEGEATDITDYAVSGGTLTFTALTTPMLASDTFKIV